MTDTLRKMEKALEKARPDVAERERLRNAYTEAERRKVEILRNSISGGFGKTKNPR